MPTGGSQSAGGGAGTSSFTSADNGAAGTLGTGGAGGTGAIEQPSRQQHRIDGRHRRRRDGNQRRVRGKLHRPERRRRLVIHDRIDERIDDHRLSNGRGPPSEDQLVKKMSVLRGRLQHLDEVSFRVSRFASARWQDPNVDVARVT